MRLKPLTVTITVQGLECRRCGWQWVPRHPDPRQCPKCRSARFDTPPAAEQLKNIRATKRRSTKAARAKVA